MKTVLFYFLVSAILSFDLSAQKFSEVEKEEIRKTFQIDSSEKTKRLVVANLNGSISVTKSETNTVELLAVRTNRAKTKSKMEDAKELVKLEIEEKENTISILVETPWNHNDGSMNYRGSEFYGFEVNFEFELKVPDNMKLFLKTVNDGDITVKQFSGEFYLENVNGAIEMTGISGSGSATTVNGNVSVSFLKNPIDDCNFQTVNGEIETEFPTDFSGEIKLKTFNGEMFTDFDFKSIQQKMAAQTSKKHKKIYRKDDYNMIKIGDGGPQLTFETLNGDIRILKN